MALCFRVALVLFLCTLSLAAGEPGAGMGQMHGAGVGQTRSVAPLGGGVLADDVGESDACSLLTSHRVVFAKTSQEQVASLQEERAALQREVERLRLDNTGLESQVEALRLERQELKSQIESLSSPPQDDQNEMRGFKVAMDASVDRLENLYHLLNTSAAAWAYEEHHPKSTRCGKHNVSVSVDSMKLLLKSTLRHSSILVNSSNIVRDNTMVGGAGFLIVEGNNNEVANNTVINNSNIGIAVPADRPYAAERPRPKQADLLREASPSCELHELSGQLQRLDHLEDLLGSLLAAKLVESTWLRSRNEFGCKDPHQVNIFIGSVLVVAHSKIDHSTILFNSNNTIVNNTVTGGGPIVKGDNNRVKNNTVAWNNNTFLPSSAGVLQQS